MKKDWKKATFDISTAFRIVLNPLGWKFGMTLDTDVIGEPSLRIRILFLHCKITLVYYVPEVEYKVFTKEEKLKMLDESIVEYNQRVRELQKEHNNLVNS